MSADSCVVESGLQESVYNDGGATNWLVTSIVVGTLM
jgi:hypothetical protein